MIETSVVSKIRMINIDNDVIRTEFKSGLNNTPTLNRRKNQLLGGVALALVRQHTERPLGASASGVRRLG